ncbi:MAG: Alpha-L-Rha alpha-1,3-L-rhamnosyltransferase [uncultured Sphingomonadaceae bacterium]|uniref:Alpha-L-Rha alpha-1,3-L-rhamnosyltransferase n=1 Tax=uncultured Sphingomonadaceae bacterium TaxID=169976 RepID=A0A6J4TSK9_9SPHN|nr:MAG: Alpha-L-Rha alpha-1,3-L-rhamnosyltransferase [uncultured Sphingomonadaceae bacterium]
MALISIAMATYKGGKYLRRQLDSLSAQTRLPDELVVCDDDSPDDTAAIVEAFAAEAPFAVRLIRNADRLGYNRNFEKVVGACSGEVIFISDQDDVWFEGKIATVVGLLDADPHALAVVNDQTIASPSGEATQTTVLGNFRRLGYSDVQFGPGCCTALRRSLLDVLLPFPGDAVPYDHWVTVMPALLGARILCEEPLQLYRRHGDNATASVFAREKPSAWTLVVAADRTGVRSAYRARMNGNRLMEDRLLERRDALVALGVGDALAGAVRELEAETRDYAARLACLDSPRASRPPMVLNMLRNGTYKRFQGYKSAVKDLIT